MPVVKCGHYREKVESGRRCIRPTDMPFYFKCVYFHDGMCTLKGN